MDELRRIRKERGLSQQRLAELAKVDKVTIVHIEGGKVSPKVETLEKLATALEVEVADFFPKTQAPLFQEPPKREHQEERRASSVFADALITTAEGLADLEPPKSLADVLKRFGILDVLYNIAEPLDEISSTPAHWERLPLDERMEIARTGLALHDTARRELERNNEYLERRREDQEANRAAAAMHEKMRAWNQRRSA